MIDRLTGLLKVLDKRYMTLNKARKIYSLMQKFRTPPRHVVEIGTYCGTGAILLAAMVEPVGGRVTTIDLPWTGEPNKHFSKIVDEYARELGVKNLSIVRRPDGAEGWFLDHFLAGGDPLDLIYLDGGHDWRNTCAQVVLSLAALRLGGWLIMDDLNSKAWPDVQRCWDHVVCRLVRPEHRWVSGGQGFAMNTQPH